MAEPARMRVHGLVTPSILRVLECMRWQVQQFHVPAHVPQMAWESLWVLLQPLHHLGGADSGGRAPTSPLYMCPHFGHVQLAP